MFFSRPKVEPEVTASDVRKAYASRIEKFFRQVEGRDLKIFHRRENSLESLFTWGEKVLEDKSELESELSLRNRVCKKVEEERDALRKSLQDAESKLRQISTQNQRMAEQHSTEIQRVVIEHSKNLAESQRKYDLDMAKANRDRENTKVQHEKYVASLTQQHQRTVESLKGDHKNRVDTMSRDHQVTVTSLVQNHQSEMETLKQGHGITVNRLKGQLLVNQSEYKGWPDEKLKMKFKELKEWVDLITAPERQELRIPKGKGLSLKLDPSGFLARVGNEDARFLLRSLIWSIFYEYFFSLPFGFGVFGPVNSKNPLLQVFNSWYTLIDGSNMKVPTGEDLMVFCNNKVANEWRSATFQSAVSVITGDESSTKVDNMAARLGASNVEKVANLIMAIFVQVINVTNGSLRADAEDEIRQITYMAREIALQFGIHPAHLQLVVPARGETIEIGKDYHDCCDADFHKGRTYQVDLVTAPGLQKIGDGRSDLTSKWTIVPCEIYPDNV